MTRVVITTVDALWKLSDLLRAGAELLDDAATHASKLGHHLHDRYYRRWSR